MNKIIQIMVVHNEEMNEDLIYGLSEDGSLYALGVNQEEWDYIVSSPEK